MMSLIKNYMIKAGFHEAPYSLYGGLFIVSIFINIAIYTIFILPKIQADPITLILGTVVALLLIQIALVIITGFALWMYYELIIFRRTSEIETVLPDFLAEVSVNLKAGMSFDKSLWNSIEPEYGVLEKEIEIA